LRLFQFRICTSRIHFQNWKRGRHFPYASDHERCDFPQPGRAHKIFRTFEDNWRSMDMSQFEQNMVLLIAVALSGAILAKAIFIAPCLAAAFSRSADVSAVITAMWSMVRPVTSLRNRLPALSLRKPSTDLPATISEESDMTLLNYVSSSAGRYPAATALIMAAVGFAVGFLLSLAVAAQSLYVCTEIL
jgi:hypothetical protein